MELSSRVSKKWEERYLVREIRFVPETGFFSPVDRLVVVGQLYGNDKSVIVEVPYHIVEIKYVRGAKPKLILHKQVVEGKQMDAFSSGDYSREELAKGEFQLPVGYKVLGLEKKVVKEVGTQ